MISIVAWPYIKFQAIMKLYSAMTIRKQSQRQSTSNELSFKLTKTHTLFKNCVKVLNHPLFRKHSMPFLPAWNLCLPVHKTVLIKCFLQQIISIFSKGRQVLHYLGSANLFMMNWQLIHPSKLGYVLSQTQPAGPKQ